MVPPEVTNMLGLLPALIACGTGQVTLEGDVPERAAPLEDTAAEVDTAAEPATYDLSRWQGASTFHYDRSDVGFYCDETVTETGALLPEGTQTRAALEAACPDCDHFYEVHPDRSQACGWIALPSTSWRAWRGEGSRALVHLWTAEGRDLVDVATVEAELQQGSMRFGYAFEAWGGLEVEVSGTMDFPLETVEDEDER
jgi:hypothetical protein